MNGMLKVILFSIILFVSYNVTHESIHILQHLSNGHGIKEVCFIGVIPQDDYTVTTGWVMPETEPIGIMKVDTKNRMEFEAHTMTFIIVTVSVLIYIFRS